MNGEILGTTLGTNMKYETLPLTSDFQPKLKFENGAILTYENLMDIQNKVSVSYRLITEDHLRKLDGFVLSDIEIQAILAYFKEKAKQHPALHND